jgi:hemerythrin superfamily protein
VQTFPARGKDAVEILLNDHQTIKQLLGELVEAGDEDSRKSVLEKLKGILTLHNATEENLVYPAIAVVAHDAKESKHLYEETAEADVLLFQLDAMLKATDDENFAATADKFRNAVLEHMDDEERSAFPALRERAKPQEERELTESVREFREHFDYEPPTDQS